MALTATELYTRLTERDSDETDPFTLRDGTTESDVKNWFDTVDVAAVEDDVNSTIDRTAVTNLTEPQDINNEDLSVSDVISSRNDNPDDYEAAYLIRSDRTVVQYFKPKVGGREPIPQSEVESLMADHVSELIDRRVNAILLSRAKTEFGA